MERDHCHRNARRTLGVAAGCVGFAMSSVAVAGPLTVAGSPGLTDGAGGYAPSTDQRVNAAGTAVANASKYDADGNLIGDAVVRWDASGAAATVLETLGADASGSAAGFVSDLNVVGTAVGTSEKYGAGGADLGTRAVRWNASGTAATELGHLGTDPSGVTRSQALALNAAGTVIGMADKHDAGGTGLGHRAVRWAAGGTVATELGTLGADPSGYTDSAPSALNASGTAVGSSEKYDAGGTDLGTRAVRWDAGRTAATELGSLDIPASGFTRSGANAINAAGTVVGFSFKHNSVGDVVKYCAVRWDAGNTAATELDSLGIYSASAATAVNVAGTAIGYSEKFDADGTDVGPRAVRWNAGGTVATELGTLRNLTSDETHSYAAALNAAGTTVGSIQRMRQPGGPFFDPHAVVWDMAGVAYDLNDLVVVPKPSGGTWTLRSVNSFADDGWAAGEGIFYPDGSGSYSRGWVGQIGLGGDWLAYTSTGTWGRGVNWSTGTPAIQLDAAFVANAAYAVAFDRDESARNVQVEAGSVTLNLTGHSLAASAQLQVYSYYATPTLIVNGGTFNVADQAFIGAFNTPGNLNVVAGARLTAAKVSIADGGSTASVLVDGTGSTVSVGNSLVLGNSGGAASHGTLTVRNGGSVNVGSELDVGQGNATSANVLNIENGGRVDVTGTTALWNNASRLNLKPGGTLKTVLLNLQGNASPFVWTGGTLELAGTGISGLATSLNIPAAGTLIGVGTVNGNVTNAGAIHPNAKPTAFAITGNLTSIGTLAFDFAANGSRSTVNVGGVASLNGNVALSISSAFTWAGKTIPLLTAGSYLGSVTLVGDRRLGDGRYVTSTFGTSVGLVLNLFDPGDATLNGQVNFDDLLLLARHYDQTSGGTWETGDFTGDGAINFDDLLALAKHYGTTSGSVDAIVDLGGPVVADWSMAQSLVPEPAGLGIVAVVAASGFARRRARCDE